VKNVTLAFDIWMSKPMDLAFLFFNALSMKVTGCRNLGYVVKLAHLAFSFFTVHLPRVLHASIHGVGFHLFHI
jgi:hypothetical protein